MCGACKGQADILRYDAGCLERLANSMDSIGARDAGYVYPSDYWPTDVLAYLREHLRAAATMLREHAAQLDGGSEP